MFTETAARGLGKGQPILSKCTVTPPSINRQHSYSTRPDGSRPTDASTVLANVASRTTPPPPRKSPVQSLLTSQSEKPQSERQTSWEACMVQRAGYISFPDFDLLRAENNVEAAR